MQRTAEVAQHAGTTVTPTSTRRVTALDRLHSLTGAVPLGVFLIYHVWSTAHATRGPDALHRALGGTPPPWRVAAEAVFVLAPLVFHAAYGVVLTIRRRRLRPSSRATTLHRLQRASGVVTLCFLAYHLWVYRLQVALGRIDSSDLFPTLVARLSATVFGGVPLEAFCYLVGLAAASFHFSVGLTALTRSFPVAASSVAGRRAAWAFAVMGVCLFAVGAHTVIFLATGSRLLSGVS